MNRHDRPTLPFTRHLRRLWESTITARRRQREDEKAIGASLRRADEMIAALSADEAWSETYARIDREIGTQVDRAHPRLPSPAVRRALVVGFAGAVAATAAMATNVLLHLVSLVTVSLAVIGYAGAEWHLRDGRGPDTSRSPADPRSRWITPQRRG